MDGNIEVWWHTVSIPCTIQSTSQLLKSCGVNCGVVVVQTELYLKADTVWHHIIVIVVTYLFYDFVV